MGDGIMCRADGKPCQIFCHPCDWLICGRVHVGAGQRRMDRVRRRTGPATLVSKFFSSRPRRGPALSTPPPQTSARQCVAGSSQPTDTSASGRAVQGPRHVVLHSSLAHGSTAVGPASGTLLQYCTGVPRPAKLKRSTSNMWRQLLLQKNMACNIPNSRSRQIQCEEQSGEW